MAVAWSTRLRPLSRAARQASRSPATPISRARSNTISRYPSVAPTRSNRRWYATGCRRRRLTRSGSANRTRVYQRQTGYVSRKTGASKSRCKERVERVRRPTAREQFRAVVYLAVAESRALTLRNLLRIAKGLDVDGRELLR